MFYIIENQEQLKAFSDYNISESFIEPILYSDSIHPAINQVSAYYIKPARSRTGFILPISHSETFSLSSEDILDLFERKVAKVYVSDRKRVKCHLPIDKPLVCLKTLKWLETGEVLDDKKYNTTAHQFLYSKYPNKADINRIIPVAKHQEKWNNYILDNKKLLSSKVQDKKYFKFYNELVNDTLMHLEWEGLQVDLGSFEKHYPESIPGNMISEGRIYTYYNINTATGRPSNTFNGVNFGAMNKADNSREFIVAKEGRLVEFDYHSYHLKILCNMIGYSFEGDDIHSHLGCMYFNTEALTPEQYNNSKNLTFKLLYTNSEEYSHIPFFSKVKQYKEELWKIYKDKGFLESPLSKRPIYGIESKTQILPYLLQSYETERNILVMNELQEYLSDKATKLRLYSYDAFLFQHHKSDGLQVLEGIQSILETDEFTTSIKTGRDYANLKRI